MAANRLAILTLALLAACGGDRGASMAADSLSRDLQRLPVDSSAMLSDQAGGHAGGRRPAAPAGGQAEGEAQAQARSRPPRPRRSRSVAARAAGDDDGPRDQLEDGQARRDRDRRPSRATSRTPPGAW